MSIAEIVNEIDGYLSCLRQARAVLLEGGAGNSHKSIAGSKKLSIAPAQPAAPAQRRAGRRGSQPTQLTSDPTPLQKPANARVRRSKTPPPPLPAETAASEPERKTPQPAAITRIPARRRGDSSRSVRRRVVERPAAATSRPAIALVRPLSNVVVVSAEQAQKQREQSAAPAPVVKPRVPSSGLSGRAAFEALFKESS